MRDKDCTGILLGKNVLQFTHKFSEEFVANIPCVTGQREYLVMLMLQIIIIMSYMCIYCLGHKPSVEDLEHVEIVSGVNSVLLACVCQSARHHSHKHLRHGCPGGELVATCYILVL